MRWEKSGVDSKFLDFNVFCPGSNPLGDDQTDIPVFHNIQAFFDQSKMLIDINLSYDEPEALRPAEWFGKATFSSLSEVLLAQ